VTGPEPAPGGPREQDGATTTPKGKGTAWSTRVSTDRRALSTLALFLAGPVIWSAHFIVVYVVVEAGCTGSGEGLTAFDPPVPRVVTLVATVVAAVACLLVAAASARRWRSDRVEHPDRTALSPGEGVAPLAFVGLLLSLLGFVTVLFVGLPVFFLPTCLP
jgi:hypothetical protein